MTTPIDSVTYAKLAASSYNNPGIEPVVRYAGSDYTVIDQADNPRTGFQASAYDRKNPDGSHNIVIAYRGTEFGREPAQDGIVDARMALFGINAQTADATAFTKRVLAQAKREQAEDPNHNPRDVTVTGHSLGGTLAELMASRYWLRGETFNPYGAASLVQGVPEGGHQVINHVRATDVVSAGGKHFGEVRTYATPEDVAHLKQAGYFNDTGLLAELRPRTMIPEILRDGGGAHGIGNYVPDSSGKTILTPGNQALAQANHYAIDRYRHDIQLAGVVVGTPGHVATYGVMTAEQAAILGIQYVDAKATQAVHAAEQAGHYLGDKATQAYTATRSTVIQGLDATKRFADQVEDKALTVAVQGVKTVKGIGTEISRESAQAVDVASERATQTFQTMRVMLKATETGVSDAFRRGTQFLAALPPGQILLNNAIQSINELQSQSLTPPSFAQPQLHMPQTATPQSSQMRR